ncbi:MAG: hypothetical protein ABI653_02775 [Bacteroidota bacterium]
MNQKILFSASYKKIGWWILIPSTIIGIIFIVMNVEPAWLDVKVFAILNQELLGKTQAFVVTNANISSTLIGVVFIIGGLFVGFSKEKNEDEFIAQTRLNALLWAVFINYIILILALLFIYGMSFLSVMVYNMFTVIILFILRFNYMLFKNSKSLPGEK